MGFLDDSGLAHLWRKIKDAVSVAQSSADTAQQTADKAISDAAAAQKTADSKQDKLTGTSYQIVGFDAKGNAVAANRWSNPNLLDNWYFADSINQRGQLEYTQAGYTIDRWGMDAVKNSIGTLQVGDGYIRISKSKRGDNDNNSIWQTIETPSKLAGKTVTFSILHRGTGISQILLFGNNAVLSLKGSLNPSSNWTLGSMTFTLPNTLTFFRCYIYHDTNHATTGYTDILAAKLELGPTQTLAHKEGDAWVLNDPPPNKALELQKCQRYYYTSSSDMGADNILGADIAYGTHAQYLSIGAKFPAEMRARPSVKIVKVSKWNSAAVNETDDNIIANGVSKTGFSFIVDKDNGCSAGLSYYIKYIADANL